MGTFSSRKGKLLLGAMLYTAGGWVLSMMTSGSSDQQTQMVFNGLLLFWTIFCFKMIYHFAWKDDTCEKVQNSKDRRSESEDAIPSGQQRSMSKKTARQRRRD